MSSKLDAYEIIGVVAPGCTLLFGLTLLFPQLNSLFFEHNFSVGDLGLFLILAFVAGHLIQAVGNIFETVVWWFFGGMPTDWLIRKPQRLLNQNQIERLRTDLQQNFSFNLSELTSSQWHPIVREIYATVQAQGNTGRIDSFNRTYGLMRGVPSTLVTLSLVALVVAWPIWKPALLAALASVISGYRMIRFGKRYGCQLMVEYLRIRAAAQS